MEDQYLEVVESVLGTDPGALANALKSAEEGKGVDVFTENLKSQIENLKKNAHRAGSNEGYGRGKKESLSGLEKSLAEKYGFEEPAEIESLIENLISKEQEKIKTIQTDPEKVKASETYRNAMKEFATEKEQLLSSITDLKSSIERERVSTLVQSEVNSVLGQYVLPENKEHANHLLRKLHEDVMSAQGNTISVKDGKLVVLTKEGQPALKSDYTGDLTVSDLARSFASIYFTKAKNDGRKGPGNSSGEGGAAKEYSFAPIKDAADYYKRLDSMKGDPAKQKALTEFWKASKK